MDWQDQLAAEVKALEANGCSLEDNDKARAMLRPLRAFVQRLSRLSLRIADATPQPSEPPARHHVGRRGPDKPKPLFRTYLVDQGVYTDDVLGRLASGFTRDGSGPKGR
jgi:hypothetical protein